MRLLYVLVLAVALPAAALAGNPFKDFYTPRADSVTLDIAPQADEIQVSRHGSDINADEVRMIQAGYSMLGYSHFTASEAKEKHAVRQGEKLGAHIVLIASKHIGSQTSTRPLFIPNTQSSSSQTTGTIFSGGRSGTITGNTTTTTSGMSAIPLTRTVDRYEFFASYWVKVRPGKFGAVVGNLSDEQRRQLQRNRGASVHIVVNGSPAFMADFLPGDVILSVNDVDVIDYADFIAKVSGLAGHTVEIELWRNGASLTKAVRLNP